ncbi:exopolysaccharide biosynthesis protein [Jannaschia rubra]|uniref:Exopolysaccharide synthesis, ExoD n=1 Tax=Jannaschia rubra TaxID=282197 RepID=A0A0M6XTS3_9RHOB|nr:exopolysaccharide biosynthesis protein [Jannaschia rubra]CTQ34027.1 Exopolysaccharide synthesis, ExoD [Jannaschia rubra]SFG24835.1 Uncharacterized conserved protein [Jannaschia rubra]
MTTATDILDALDETTEDGDSVSIGQISDKLGHRGAGAALVVPAAIEWTPIGGIPGVPTFIALIIAIFAGQILWGRDDLWLPHWVGKRSVSADKMGKAVDKLRGIARWSDRHLGRHLTVLVDGPAPRLAALAVLGLCLTIPPLELLPFASSIPTGAIMLFGIAMVTRDGRVMAMAWAAFLGALVSVWWLWP